MLKQSRNVCFSFATAVYRKSFCIYCSNIGTIFLREKQRFYIVFMISVRQSTRTDHNNIKEMNKTSHVADKHDNPKPNLEWGRLSLSFYDNIQKVP